MERSEANNNSTTPTPDSSSAAAAATATSIIASIDGSLGLWEEDSYKYARRFFRFGFFVTPAPYLEGSAISFCVFMALTFATGGTMWRKRSS